MKHLFVIRRSKKVKEKNWKFENGGGVVALHHKCIRIEDVNHHTKRVNTRHVEKLFVFFTIFCYNTS